MNGEFDNAREDEREAPPAIEGDGDESQLSPAERIQLLYLTLEKRTKEAAEANETYLRASADFENYRKRMQRDQVEFRKYANEQIAGELLTVVDHLGLALKHSTETGSGEGAQSLRQGVQLVYKQLCDVLEKFGIKRFSAEGEPFDPSKHEAMMQVSTGDVPENTVVQVLQDGYLYHEKILRHAKVGVSKKPDEAQQGTTENEGMQHTTTDDEAIPEEAVQAEAGEEELPQNEARQDNGVQGEAPQEESRKKKRKKR